MGITGVAEEPDGSFEIVSKRWIVERTSVWWNRYRHLSKDYELLPEVSESMIYTVMIQLMLKRLAQSHTTASQLFRNSLLDMK